jgi:hypothetical protein
LFSGFLTQDTSDLRRARELIDQRDAASLRHSRLVTAQRRFHEVLAAEAPTSLVSHYSPFASLVRHTDAAALDSVDPVRANLLSQIKHLEDEAVSAAKRLGLSALTAAAIRRESTAALRQQLSERTHSHTPQFWAERAVAGDIEALVVVEQASAGKTFAIASLIANAIGQSDPEVWLTV